MNSTKPMQTPEVGHQLVDSISVPNEKLNLLFAALLLTSLGVFVGSNLLLLDVSVLLRSAQVALPCLGLLLIFYAISRTSGSVIWGLVLTYGLMLLLVYTRQAWLTPVLYGVVLMALGYAIRFLRLARAQQPIVLLMAVIATVTILGVSRGPGHSPIWGTFDALERLRADTLYRDTLFHASIAAMIKNYGVVSTGLHGLVETPYHMLSHALFAGLSLLSGLGTIEVYGVASWVFFAPILVFGIVACSAMLDRANVSRVPLTWSIACVLLAATPFLLGPWAVWDKFAGVSESYTISLGLLLLGFPLLFKRRLILSDLLLIAILTMLISMAKMSVGPIFAGLWFVRLLFVRGESAKTDLIALTLAAAAAVWVVFHFAGGIPGVFRVSPLTFIVTYSFMGDALLEAGGALRRGTGLSLQSGLLAIVAVLSFFAFHFVFSWVVAVQIAWKKGIAAVFSSPISVYALAAASVGALFVLLLETPGADAFWFSNVALFVALPGVVAWTGQSLGQWQLPSRRLLILSILLVCLVDAKNLYRASTLSPAYLHHQQSAFVDSLLEVRRTTILNVVLRPDKQVLAYNPVSDCRAQPFVFPAVSERPWVDVIAARSDCTYEFYGYDQYGLTASKQAITVQPRLLPGMVTLSWPDTSSDFKPNY